MREEETEEERNWFARWEEQLPTPEELMPLSQTLITTDLALAFDIPSPSAPNPNPSPPPSSLLHHQPPQISAPEFDSADGNGGADEPARTLKRPRLVWTPQLHKRFVDAVAHLGIKNAVPKTIMQLMSVDGLTRENVASHLQKYRLYLKRMQGINSGGSGGGSISAADDQLFSSIPISHNFLSRGAGGGAAPEAFLPYVPVAALQQHHQNLAAAAAAAQQQYYHQRQVGGFDHGFLARPQLQPGGVHRMVGPAGLGMVQPQSQQPSYAEDLDSGGGSGGRRVLTLFPTGGD